MALSNKQIELLKTISNRLQRGDIKAIAEKTGVPNENVGRALNMTTDFFNEKVIDAAVELIKERDEKAEQHLQALSATV